jgi:hypothetical protein
MPANLRGTSEYRCLFDQVLEVSRLLGEANAFAIPDRRGRVGIIAVAHLIVENNLSRLVVPDLDPELVHTALRLSSDGLRYAIAVAVVGDGERAAIALFIRFSKLYVKVLASALVLLPFAS